MSKASLQGKIGYYKGQLEEATRRYVRSTKRTDRDIVLKYIARIDTYKELLSEIKE